MGLYVEKPIRFVGKYYLISAILIIPIVLYLYPKATIFIIAVSGIVGYLTYLSYKKADAEKIEPEPINYGDPVKPDWGWGVVYYKKGPAKSGGAGVIANHFMTVEEITRHLGSNYPLYTGNEKYWQAWGEPQESLKWASKIVERSHADGHLHIGGHMYWDGQGHMITIGANRSGKGTCLIVPALLNNLNYLPLAPSFICLDPKGENLAIAGAYLKRAGYKVVTINPFNIPEISEFGSSGFNVFDSFKYGDPDFDQYADMIANGVKLKVRTKSTAGLIE